MGVGIQILSDFAKVICGAMATQPSNSDDYRKPRGHEPKSEVLAAVAEVQELVFAPERDSSCIRRGDSGRRGTGTALA